MKLIANKRHKVTKRIKIHTKPLVEVDVVQEGIFDHETKGGYSFRGFFVKKAVVTSIEEVSEDV